MMNEYEKIIRKFIKERPNDFCRICNNTEELTFDEITFIGELLTNMGISYTKYDGFLKIGGE